MAKRRRSRTPTERNVPLLAASIPEETQDLPEMVSPAPESDPMSAVIPEPLREQSESASMDGQAVSHDGNTAPRVQHVDSATASPLHSADGSQSEVPEASKHRKSTTSGNAPPRGLDRTIEMLQQSHLWMGGKTLPGLVLDAAAPTVRMTRRMAAAAQSAASDTTPSQAVAALPAQTNSVAQSIALQQPASSTPSAEVPQPQVPAVNAQTEEPVGVKSEEEQPKPAALLPAVELPVSQQIEPKMGKRKYSYTKLRPVELHVDHPFFERLRFVPLISKKAPVAQEQDVIASSSHCTPRPLSVFANLLLQYAPEEIMSRAQASRH